MVKHIGIVACSAEGAALCYKTICEEGEKFLKRRYAHPEVTLNSLPFDEYMDYISAGKWDKVGLMMLESAEKLASAGAEFLICPDNTIHNAYDLIINKSPLPWLHIAEEVAKEAKSRKFNRLAILGTKFLMESQVYPDKLKKFNIDYLIPEEKEREKINEIIFNELVYGKFLEKSEEYFYKVIEGMKDRGCDAVVLGCTEIPLLVKPEKSPLPTLDSTRILAYSALKFAIKEEEEEFMEIYKQN